MSNIRVIEAQNILSSIGMPLSQSNERSGLVLLALLEMASDKQWPDASAKLIGITPIMNWCDENYRKKWKPNTRETIRRQTIHQFVAAGIVLSNPDDPDRATNSKDTAYQISAEALQLFRAYGRPSWSEELRAFLAQNATLYSRYAAEREARRVPVVVPTGGLINLSAGKHSELIKAIIEDFASRFVPGSQLIYVGDTGKKWAFFDENRLKELGVAVGSHGKIPDVVLFDNNRGWLILVESVTSHGPVDRKRRDELETLFQRSAVGLVYVTAFATRITMKSHLPQISWETEVWCADAPTHLIHFNGDKFLGPY